MFCEKCGAEVQNNASFCPNCGNKIETADRNIETNSNHKNGKKLKIITLTFILIVAVVIMVAVVVTITVTGKSGYENRNNIQEQLYPDSDLYDKVLASGDGYFLVSKYEENYDYSSMKFGIIDEKNNWILPLTEDSIFGIAYKDAQDRPLEYKYINCGVFACSEHCAITYPDGSSERIGYDGGKLKKVYCYSTEYDCEFSFEAEHITTFENNYMLMYPDDRYNESFYKIDVQGNITELPVKWDSYNGYNGLFPSYSDGLFYANRYFYNIDGEAIINLTDYDLAETNLRFANGKCEFKFKNPGGTLYYAVIDKNGDFIEEPKQVPFDYFLR